MQSITLNKISGESYKPNSYKVYEAKRGDKTVGTISQDFGMRWEVVNADFERVSLHTTIKAAVRVAGRVL